MNSNRRRGYRTVALAVGFVGATVGAAFAQTQSVLYGALNLGYRWTFPDAGPTVLHEMRIVDGQLQAVREVSRVDGALLAGPVVSGDGRYVIWLAHAGNANPPNPRRIAVFDRVTETMAFVPGLVDIGTIVSDPTGLRLWGVRGASIDEVTPGGLRTIYTGAGGSVSIAGVSEDGMRLFLATTEPVGQLLTVDSRTGDVLASVPFPQGSSPSGSVVSPNGTHLYAPHYALSGHTLLKIEMATGTVVATLALPPPPPFGFTGVSSMVVDDTRRRLVASLSMCADWHCSGEYWTVDTETMTELARVPTAGPALLNADRSSGHVVAVAEHVYYRYGSCGPSRAGVVSLDSGQLLSTSGDVILPANCVATTLAVPPQPPHLLAPVVAGSVASLDWEPRGIATSYVVDVGSAPGLSNLAALPVAGDQTTVMVPNVPAGTYFVRVRALNYVGASASSNEVMVVVP